MRMRTTHISGHERGRARVGSIGGRCGDRNGADCGAPCFLFAHERVIGTTLEPDGISIRRPHGCHPGRRFVLDHEPPEPQHDADDDWMNARDERAPECLSKGDQHVASNTGR